ncbi:MAG: hypothetical protein IJC88_06340 [Oscillospiraceae bacterium]|nr:hypothetical protein [Oscillospiraceae bacterium]
MKQLNFFEEAEQLAREVKRQGYSQAYAAKRLGFTQSALSNKLRLLKLSPELQKTILEFCLTERHARALLRLEEDRREIALAHIIAHSYNVSETEAYIDSLLLGPKNETVMNVCPELKPFYDGIHKTAQTLRTKGRLVEICESGSGSMITIQIHVHRK